MKVRSERGSRRRSLRSARIGAALLVVTLIGAGSVPTLVAFAQMVEDEQMVITDAGLGLNTVDSHPNPDKMRTPSGLGTLEEQAAGTRTATVVPRPAAASRPAVRPAARTAAPTAPAAVATSGGVAWKTARVSWYGPGFYGNTMAGGGILQPGSMVVAHRTLAFGTKIEFSYGGRTCIATVQDRGPFTAGRVFDLGPGTAKALGFSGVGTVSYRIL
ncbi:MAG: septal ring lytic transglycosylase RlpA family protein [Coriobacteriia bacterium]